MGRKSNGLDPNERVTPIIGGDTHSRLNGIIKRHGGRTRTDIDPTRMAIPMPKRGPVKDQMEMEMTDASTDEP